MLALIEITLDATVLGAIILSATALGYIIKNARTKSSKRAIEKLELEMLNSHAEILKLQKELAAKENQQPQAPIVSMRESTSETSKENLTDVNLRKKLLSNIGKANP